jgi:hypothetical protein
LRLTYSSIWELDMAVNQPNKHIPALGQDDTTSLTPQYYDTAGSAFASAIASAVASAATVLLLSNGRRVFAGRISWAGHGLTVNATYYLSQTVAGQYVTPAPSSGLIQPLFFVDSPDTIQVGIQNARTSSGSATPIIQRFTANSTYTPTPGMVKCRIQAVGGGGGGTQGGPATGTAFKAGPGGGAGGYLDVECTAAEIGVSRAIVIGGGGGVNASGGTTSIAGIGLAVGGAGGAGTAAPLNSAGNYPSGLNNGGNFSIAGGTNIASAVGEQGQRAESCADLTGRNAFSGSGGKSALSGNVGLGAYMPPGSNSTTATASGSSALANSGCGGGGGIGGNNTTGAAGVGGSGLVIITEYF